MTQNKAIALTSSLFSVGSVEVTKPNYQLSTINYQLSTINYQLSTINYQLSTIQLSIIRESSINLLPMTQNKAIALTSSLFSVGSVEVTKPNYQLSTINYQLSTINYQLSTINYQLSTINYPTLDNPGK